VSCDLFHYGHVRFFEQARKLGDVLVVGVCSDDDLASFKREPILSLEERCEVVRACRMVDEVIPAAPPYVSYEFIARNNIDVVAASDGYDDDAVEAYYRHPRDAGILRFVPRTPNISSSIVLRRCQETEALTDCSVNNLAVPITDRLNRFGAARATLYEEMYGVGHQSTAAEIVAREASSRLRITSSDRVLDVGCGTGGTAVLLAHDTGASVTGVDLSHDSIELCTSRAPSRPALPVTFVLADACDLVLGTPFDVLWTRDTLLYIRDKRSCLSRLRRYLVPERLSAVIETVRGAAVSSRELEDHAYSCGHALVGVDDYAELLRSAGFAVIDNRDYTAVCVETMVEELTNLERNRETFVQRRSAAEYDHLVERWSKKIGFYRTDQLNEVGFLVRPQSGID
jgi:cytidyltransferase-like protein